MDTNVVLVDASSSVSDVIRSMASSNSWSIIVERSGLPIGIVTERDVLRRCLAKGLNPDKTRVEEIMSSPIISVSPDDHLGKAMDLMVQKDTRRVFVVDNGKIVGKITQTKMFDNAVSMIESLASLKYQM
jgi:CBS domain-containing protein